MSYGDYYPPPNSPLTPPQYSPYPLPRSNGLAVASLITGILGFMCLIPALVAIGLGVAGLSQSRQSGVGRGMSIAGICLGVFWIVAFVLLIVAVVAIAPSN
jgi:hypothetical protein